MVNRANYSHRLLSLEALHTKPRENESLITWYYIVRHFLTPALCLLSMSALIFTIVFLHRRKLCRITARIYLKVMGYVDFVSLLILFISSLDYFMLSAHVHAYYTSAFVRCLHGCLLGLLLASNWLMTFQAIERTFVISKPFRAKQIRERHRRWIVSVICGSSVILMLPTLAMDIAELTRYENYNTQFVVQYSYDELHIESVFPSWQNDKSNRTKSMQENVSRCDNQSRNTKLSNLTRTDCDPAILSDTWPNSLIAFQLAQAWIVHFILFFVLPFFLLCLSSFRLLYAVRLSSRFVRQNCVRGGIEFRTTVREEARMTILVLCLIGAFFTCQSPFVAYSACRRVGLLSTPSPGHSLLRAFIIVMLVLKTDCTFVFHCWLNQRFFFALRRILCSFSSAIGSGKCPKNKDFTSSTGRKFSSRFSDRQQHRQEFDIAVQIQRFTASNDRTSINLNQGFNTINPNGTENYQVSSNKSILKSERWSNVVHMKNIRNNILGTCSNLIGSSHIEQEMSESFSKAAYLIQSHVRKQSTNKDKFVTRNESGFPRRSGQMFGIRHKFFSENDLQSCCTNSLCSCSCSCICSSLILENAECYSRNLSLPSLVQES